jgi:trigger factor
MSMQIVEKSGEGLSRVYGVVVPAAELNARLDKRIAEVGPQMQLKGFRPGKVPASHVRKLYGKGLMQEVVEQAMDDSQREALDKVKLRPAASPDIKMESDIGKVLDGKEDLAFELAIEVMPDFQPIDPGSLTLKRMVHTPTDDEVMEALKEIAEGSKTYETKGGKTPKAAEGDMIVMDFVGSIDGVKFDGGSGEDAELVIGSGRFIPGFEEQLKGAKPGDEVTVKVTFPADYGAKDLAGKAAEFAVTVKEVKAPKKAVVDEALAERLGLGDLDALKKLVKDQLANQNAGAARFKL